MAQNSAFFDGSGIRVLLVTDDDLVFSILKQHLKPEGYVISRSNSAEAVLDLIQDEPYSIILAENDLPEQSGLALFARLQQSHATVARLLLFADLPAQTILKAVKSRTIYRSIPKPWRRDELLVTFRAAAQFNRLISENEAIHNKNIELNLRISGASPTRMSRRSSPEEPREGANSERAGEPPLTGPDVAMMAFTRMLYTFHPNLGNTAVRTAALCRSLSEVLALSPDDANSLIWAATVHDISLIQFDRELVRRWVRGPEKCSDQEIAVIEKHPHLSQRMLEDFEYLAGAGEIVRSHHEYWDGSGYPEGLKGDGIPWLSRLLCVAIAYSSDHSPSIQAMAAIEEEAETKFDPSAITALSKAAPRTKMPKGEREILLIELKHGMVLARDIFNANGFLLLPEGSKITEASISKIWSVNRVAPIDPFILVYG